MEHQAGPQIQAMAQIQPRPQVQPGFRVGRLTVVAATSQRKNGYTVWRCWCDCGGELLLDTRALQRGAIQDCGCRSRVKPGQRDITGKRFGKLMAEYSCKVRSKDGSMLWHCRCDCGGQVDASLHQLCSGYRKSCGCLSRPTPENLMGRQFGLLTVLEYAGKVDGIHFWRCRCKCGKETVVRSNFLLTGHTKSCGCLQREQVLDNLRLVDGTSVTILEAAKHRLLATNTSGCRGVYLNKRTRKWVAQITFKGKTHYLGSYERFEDAVKARQRGEELHDDFLQWYYAEHPQKIAGES